jgi:hypothetical protein
MSAKIKTLAHNVYQIQLLIKMMLRIKTNQLLSRISLPELKQKLCLKRQNLMRTKRKILKHPFQQAQPELKMIIRLMKSNKLKTRSSHPINKNKILNKKNRYNRKMKKAKTKIKIFHSVTKILSSIIITVMKEVTKKISQSKKSHFKNML